ncbi:hypothetical protein BW85_11580 [Escherichia coli O69:H11 str. 06-3325]|nr:hypothetical protein BW85_11580 [Escherichia coli O69:H11 str. 06-3325]
MRLDRLTNKFQLALADAQSLALGHDNQFIEPLHLMSALLNQEGGSVSPLLTSAGINAGQLRTDINQALNRLPQVEGTGGDVQPSQDLVRVLNLCDKLAQKRGDNFISSELFVLTKIDLRIPYLLSTLCRLPVCFYPFQNSRILVTYSIKQLFGHSFTYVIVVSKLLAPVFNDRPVNLQRNIIFCVSNQNLM